MRYRWDIAITLAVALLASSLHSAAAQKSNRDPAFILTAGPVTQAKAPESLSPEARMQRRYPQPVKVGDLIGLPVLDDDDRTLGRVKAIVSAPNGKIQLIVPYGGLLGLGQRLVAVPIEVVAIAGRQLAALDMTRAEFDAAPAWNDAQSVPLPASQIIRVGLYKR
jgi:hypothetical protein